MLSQGSLPPLVKVSGLKDLGAASANTWLTCASRELSCQALEGVTYLCGGAGLGFTSETLWHLGCELIPPCAMCGWGWQGTAQCSHSLSTPWTAPTPSWHPVGWDWGLDQFHPDSWDDPTLPRARFGSGFACEGSPRASPHPQPCTALLGAPPDISRVPEDSPAPVLSPNTILAACLLPHVSFSD